MDSLQAIADFVDASNLKSKEDLGGIFTELVVKYPEETKRQHSIRGMVMLFEAKYPEEMKEHEKAMKAAKELSNNEFASNDEAKMRLAFKIPQSLVTRINMVVEDPLFLTEEADKMFGEVAWFKTNFPRYTVPDVF